MQMARHDDIPALLPTGVRPGEVESGRGATSGPTRPGGLAAAAGMWAIIAGCVTLSGWFADMQRLTDWTDEGISMFPNAAVCAVASGLALLVNGRESRRLPRVTAWLGIVVGLIGGLTLVEHLTGLARGSDPLLLRRWWGQGAADAPRRIGLPASVSFLLVGTALVLLGRGPRARGVSAVCGVIVATIATLPLVGHLYGAHQMYTIPGLTG